MTTYVEKLKGYLFSDDTDGAVKYEDCTTRRRGKCRCGPCRVCGHQMHTAVHGPSYGEPAGSKPWGHKFVPMDGKEQ